MHPTNRFRFWAAVVTAEVAGLFVAAYAGFVGLIMAAPQGFWGEENDTTTRQLGAAFVLVASFALVAGPLVGAALRRRSEVAIAAAAAALVLWGLGLGLASSMG